MTPLSTACTPRKFGAPCSPTSHSVRDFILIGPIGSTVAPIFAPAVPKSFFASQASSFVICAERIAKLFFAPANAV
jgi:hypothetical protein